jgi:hypothetical protein
MTDSLFFAKASVGIANYYWSYKITNYSRWEVKF